MAESEQILNVTALPAFEDNYIWLIDNGTRSLVVDPGDAGVVMKELAQRSLFLNAVLVTHRHNDHTDGIQRLVTEHTPPVYGPQSDDLPFVTHPRKEGDPLIVEALGLSFEILNVPGHTYEHIAYYERRKKWLFCGDMLFGAGCGRMFEGTPEMMISSLSKFIDLPDDTLVFAGHEYTVSNLRFALEIEPDNKDIIKRMQDESAKREMKRPTLPSTITLEKKTNPFLRNESPDVLERLLALGLIKSKNPVDAFAAMREWKNIYR